MDKMKISRRSVNRTVHVHRRYHDAVADSHTAQVKRSEHRRNGTIGLLARCPAGEPALNAFEVVLVANTQVLMAHALTTRQQAVGELLGIEIDVAPYILKPFHRVARRILQTQGFSLALVLIALECA